MRNATRAAVLVGLTHLYAMVGCTPPTRVIVRVDAPELLLQQQITGVVVRGYRLRPPAIPDPDMPDHEIPITGERLRFPFSTRVTPLDDSSRRFLVEATATVVVAGEVPQRPQFITVRAISGFAPGRTWEVGLEFDRTCLDVRCGLESTCRNRECVPAAVPLEGEDAGTVEDAGMSLDDAPTSMSRTYVIDAISIPNSANMGQAPGFNLDGLNSDGLASDCVGGRLDFSFGDIVGVDNEFVGNFHSMLLAGGFSAQTSVDRHIARGALLLALRVNGIDSFVADSSVTLDLLLVRQTDCAASPCPARAGVQANQAWRQDAAALTPTPVLASIEGGVLRGPLPIVPLGISDSMNLALTVHDAQISAAIGPDSLTSGVIGGRLRLNELVDALEEVSPGSAVMTRPIIQMSADLQPTAEPNICDAISIGVGFTAVSAMSIAPL